MNIIARIMLLTGVTIAAQGASAEELSPGQGYSVHLGAVVGTVYFEPEGLDARLVATLSSGPEAAPMRLVAHLADWQSTVISVPGASGEPAMDVTFTRRGDKVVTSNERAMVASNR